MEMKEYNFTSMNFSVIGRDEAIQYQLYWENLCKHQLQMTIQINTVI